MVIGVIDETLKLVNITDRYATAFALPNVDECSNWNLISG